MQEKEKDIMLAMQKWPENKLTREIIIPLFECLGFFKVEFYGGTNEEGKDILCWEEDKLGDVRLITAQVKHFKLTNRASDTKSLQTVVNQLINCFSKPIPYIDKSTHIPYEAFLVSTHTIDTKSIQSRFSANPNLNDRKIKIIDGIKLATLIVNEKPELINTVLGEDIDYFSYYKDTLNNDVLLKALGHQDSKEIESLYIDIDFALGRKTTKLFFKHRFKSTTIPIHLTSSKWKEFKKILIKTKGIVALNYLDSTIPNIEKKYKQSLDELEVWKVKFSKLNNHFTHKRTELEELEIYLKYRKKKEAPNKETKKSISELEEKWKTDRAASDILTMNDEEIFRLFEDKEKKFELLAENVADIKATKPSPFYSFSINGRRLELVIKEKVKWIKESILALNKNQHTSVELRRFIEHCNDIFDATSILLNDEFCNKALGLSNEIIVRSDFESTRLKLSIDELIDTGLNLILLGEAGAGKTTSLQMYALKNRGGKNRLIFWIPLAHALQNWSRSLDNQSDEKKAKYFESVFTEYLKSKGISIPAKEFQKMIKVTKTIFLLDGLDEAIKSNPWLPEAILKFSQDNNKNAQVVVTSRTSGPYIEMLPYFAISLLPFTIKQRNLFITKWFGSHDSETVKVMMSHLNKNKSINEITRNPLLTTTICVLAQHGLPLPQTEIKLYYDRLRLLTGYYDNVKNIVSRISTTPHNLELLSQKLAFYLQSKGIRESDIETLQNQASKLMKHHMNSKESKVAINELIDPCNILVPMTEDGKYGFGHLRFQEHLAAIELLSDRGINILRYLNQSWWKETLILFAQMSQDLKWLVNEIGHSIDDPEIFENLNSMVYVRPKKEQDDILRSINLFRSEANEFPDIDGRVFN